MPITLQTALPQKVLPRAPSPNAALPNPGIRSNVTQFVPASPDQSHDNDSGSTDFGAIAVYPPSTSNALPLLSSVSSGTPVVLTAGPLSPELRRSLSSSGRPAFTSAGAGSRRGIAHSTKVLGTGADPQEEWALSQLQNGKVDVSFEASLELQDGQKRRQTKGKAREVDELDAPLFDVDLEAAVETGPKQKRKLLSFGKMKSSTNQKTVQSNGNASQKPVLPYVPAEQASTLQTQAPQASPASPDTVGRHVNGDARESIVVGVGIKDQKGYDRRNDEVQEEEEEDDADQVGLLGASAPIRPAFFAAGDRSFGYSSINGVADAHIGFESITMREKSWMGVSALLVLLLVAVAILISVDVIDWPGDGIGRT